MLKSYILHSVLAVSLLTTFDVAQPKMSPIPGDLVSGLSTHTMASEEVPHLFPSMLEAQNSLKIKDRVLPPHNIDPPTSRVGAPKPSDDNERTSGERLDSSTQSRDPRSEADSEHLTSGLEHTVSRASSGIEVGKRANSEKEMMNFSTHLENLPDALEINQHELKIALMNTDNLYVFLSQECFRKHKRWVPYSREWLKSLRPYKNFFDNIGNVLSTNREESMGKFLLSVAHLRIDGFEKFSISKKSKFEKYKKRIIDSLGSGCEALKENNLVYSNRLRIVGMIQYLKDYLPQKSKSLEDAFAQHSLSFQAALELFFTRDHRKALAAEIESPFTKRLDRISSDVRECFDRAAFMSRHEASVKEGLLGDSPQEIHVLTSRYLLGDGLPKDEGTIKKFTSDLENLIAGNTLSGKEASYATAIVAYLWRFPNYRGAIVQLLHREKFVTNFLKPKAQETIKSFWENKDNHVESGKKAYVLAIGLLENKLPPSHDSIQSLLDAMGSESVDIRERVELLHLLNARFVLQPESRPIVFQKMYGNQIEFHVAEVWSYIGSQQAIFRTSLDVLDAMVFRLHPALLTSSFRRVLGAKLQAQENKEMQLIGQSLANLPRHDHQEALPESQTLYDHMESILSSVPDANQHFECLEVYLHLLWYNPQFATQLISSMVQKYYFNDNILFFSNRALSKTPDTSGIAREQLTIFSKILNKIYWEIKNSELEGPESETKAIQLNSWAQQLCQITPI